MFHQQCIPNYPDKNLPTMLIYRNGELHRQIVGLRPEIGLDGMNTKLGGESVILFTLGHLLDTLNLFLNSLTAFSDFFDFFIPQTLNYS